LRVTRIEAQRHEHLALPLPSIVHVAPDDRDPAVVAVFIAQSLENPLRRVVLFGRSSLIFLQDLVDDPEEWIQLRSYGWLTASISWRHRECQHLRHRSWIDPETPRRFPLTDSLYINRSSHQRV